MQHDVVMPPAPVLQAGQAGVAAVGAVHHVVRFARGGRLVTAAGEPATCIPGVTAESRDWDTSLRPASCALRAPSGRGSVGNSRRVSQQTARSQPGRPPGRGAGRRGSGTRSGTGELFTNSEQLYPVLTFVRCSGTGSIWARIGQADAQHGSRRSE
jgi:hypothetical protein